MLRIATHAPVLTGAMLIIASCASRTGGTETSNATGGTRSEPQLVECAGYRPPPGGVGAIRAVEVQYLVKSDGSVDAASITVVRRPPESPGVQADLVQRARDAARNCHYSPGRLAGQPVEALVRRTFRFVI